MKLLGRRLLFPCRQNLQVDGRCEEPLLQPCGNPKGLHSILFLHLQGDLSSQTSVYDFCKQKKTTSEILLAIEKYALAGPLYRVSRF